MFLVFIFIIILLCLIGTKLNKFHKVESVFLVMVISTNFPILIIIHELFVVSC